LKGKEVEVVDTESDIDFAVLFKTPHGDSLKTYAMLSLDLQELVTPFKADLLFYMR
jgi:predicted nucleotidyltransferase